MTLRLTNFSVEVPGFGSVFVNTEGVEKLRSLSSADPTMIEDLIKHELLRAGRMGATQAREVAAAIVHHVGLRTVGQESAQAVISAVVGNHMGINRK